MPVQRDFTEFHKSIATELSATQDRIRNLIGDSHWLTDGEHKEAVLRKILRNHIPDLFHVGKGFVCFKSGTSTQIDILITDKKHPTLFRDGDLRIVTPDAVRAIIEVKTSINSLEGKNGLKNTLAKLSKNTEEIKKENKFYGCWAGLFVFSGSQLTHENVLSSLASTTGLNERKIINCIAFGENLFFRFWEKGSKISSPIDGKVWHSYELSNLAFAYFIGNIVYHLSWERALGTQYAWFPIEGGKERKREYYIGFGSKKAKAFFKDVNVQ